MPRKTIYTATLFLLASSALHGLPPTIGLNSYGGISFAPEETSSFVRAGASADYRTGISSDGYLRIRGFSDLAYLSAPLSSFQDKTSVDVDLLLPVWKVELDSGAGLTASGRDLQADGTVLSPRWNFGIAFPRGYAAPDGRLFYTGNYRFERETNNDTLHQSLGLEFGYTPSIRTSFLISLKGGAYVWTDPGIEQQNTYAQLHANTERLIGYFTKWSASFDSRILKSAIEQNSKLTNAVGTGIDWSPVRQLGLDAVLDLEHSYYYTTKNHVLFAGATARGDYTPNDRLYFILEIGGGRRIGTRPDDDSWSSTVQIGLEFSF